MPLDEADAELIEAARAIIIERYATGRHAVGAALRSHSGAIYRGIHLECTVGRIAVCAEAIAIGQAALDGADTNIETIVAVRRRSPDDDSPAIVAPCGMCREMIADYAPQARVIVPGVDGPDATTIAALLPNKYRRD